MKDTKTEEDNKDEAGAAQSEAGSSEEVVDESEEPAARNSDDFASFILMWALILAIAFLVYRRLKKHYGFDLVTFYYSMMS